MTVKLLTELHFVSKLKRKQGRLVEYTIVKIPHCWKSHITAHLASGLRPNCLSWLGIKVNFYFLIKEGSQKL